MRGLPLGWLTDHAPTSALGRSALLGAGCLGLAGLLAGCGGGPISTAASGVGCSVTVQIPAQGTTTLGRVLAEYGSHSRVLTRNTDTFQLGCGENAHLTALATDGKAHPFTGWSVAGQTSRSSSIDVAVDGLVTATPHFLVARPKVSPSPAPTSSPKVTPATSPSPATVALDQWVSYDQATRTLTWKLVAAYHDVNHGLSFDGYASGGMTVTVPTGWTVVVNFGNVGTLNHSAAVVTDTGTTPVFPGAAVANLAAGIAPGGTDTFSFSADTAGSYRMACLMPGHEQAGMWVAFDVATNGSPSVHT